MTFTVLSPATELPIAELDQAGVEEADAALAWAKAAYPGSPARWWSRRRTTTGSHVRRCSAPIAAVIPFEDEATRRSGSPARAGHVTARALGVARATEAGVLSVNANTSVRVQTPFGGFKPSGFGRELGMHTLDGYPEVKSVFISTEG